MQKQYYIDLALIFMQTKTVIAYKRIHELSLIRDR